ncbi:MAG: hypothetical protein JW861_11390 [Bacteroidales bacterium]|nr:hypothetical protein [Bacteroidales bacterium]
MKKICFLLVIINMLLMPLIIKSQIIVDLKVFLEGPFFNGSMTPWLNWSGNLPLDQPYSVSPWYYFGQDRVTSIPNSNVIDWVLVELRQTTGDASTATLDSTIARQAGFVLKDGKVVGVDGSSKMQFNVTINSNLYVVVKHRNHLAILSAYPVQLNGGVYTYDFSDAVDKVYGGANGHKQIGPGIWVMIAGDGNADGNISNVDKIEVWVPQSGSSGYYAGDYNLNSQVDNIDKNDYWNPNSGKGTQVVGGVVNTPPLAVLQFTPSAGTTITAFTFDATGCHDGQTIKDLLAVRWDFENDGSWDTPYSYDKITVHQYVQPGNYAVKLEVIDIGGLTGTDITNIIVTQSYGVPCPGIPNVTYGGQIYNTVQIGTQCWLKENLNIGAMIPGTNNQTNNGVIEKFCYDNDPANCDVYGGLYQWDEMMQYLATPGVQGICPDGWHLPTDEDWKELEGFADSQYGYPDPEWNQTGWRGYDAGLNLKSITGWNSGGNGTNLYGFSALPGGYRNTLANFDGLGASAGWHSSTEYSSTDVWIRTLHYTYDEIYRRDHPKIDGRSVRCIKDWSCGDTLIDTRDNQTYTTVQIGTQCWLKENLNIGTMIPVINNQTNNGVIEKFCYDNDPANCEVYGGLYQWNEMMQYVATPGTQGICPDGWHLPTDDEYCVLAQYIDTSVVCGLIGWNGTDAGYRMKSTTGWYGGGNGSNSSGFTVLPAGGSSSGNFSALTTETLFHTSTEGGTNGVWSYHIAWYSTQIYRNSYYKTSGFSVRCLKDVPSVWSCGDPILDTRDNKAYNTVQIGSQCWMTESLNIGTQIPGADDQSDNGTIEKYCYNDNSANCDEYGGLYQWNEMMQYITTPGTQGICPPIVGWHVPTVADWTVLSDFLGGISVAGGKMKEVGYNHWNSPNTGATNISGFTSLGAGTRDIDGNFYHLKNSNNIWSSITNGTTAWNFRTDHNDDDLDKITSLIHNGFTVRCMMSLNQPPYPPENPNPSDGASDQSINVQLSWSCTDPENDPLSFDVYFGTINPPSQVSSGLTVATYDPGTLSYSTTYYWKIVAHDDHGNMTEGMVWTFSTMSNPLLSNLISYWKIDETSGSTSFDSHSTNHCAVQTGVTINQNGLMGKAASFIETSGGLTTGKTASQLGIGGGASKSVSIWIKPSSLIYGPNSNGIINLGTKANQKQFGITFYGSLPGAHWMFDSWYGPVQIGPYGNKLDDGNWHHIVVTYNSEGHKIRTYLDGNFVIEDSSYLLNTGDQMGFSIGIGSQGNYIGLIDEVGLWSRPLTDDEVQELFNNGNGLPYPF